MADRKLIRTIAAQLSNEVADKATTCSMDIGQDMLILCEGTPVAIVSLTVDLDTRKLELQVFTDTEDEITYQTIDLDRNKRAVAEGKSINEVDKEIYEERAKTGKVLVRFVCAVITGISERIQLLLSKICADQHLPLNSITECLVTPKPNGSTLLTAEYVIRGYRLDFESGFAGMERQIEVAIERFIGEEDVNSPWRHVKVTQVAFVK